MKTRIHAIILSLGAFLGGCGDDQVQAPTTGPVEVNQTIVEPPSVALPEPPPPLPPLMPSELDQAQEAYDEQTVTSFGVGKRGWQSYKASMSGYLTRFSLYGCAHSKNKIYGKSISGEIRLARTDEKLGTWSLTRDEVVAQLKVRGLKETNYEWIDVTISDDQRIPQVAGETYVIRSTKISDGRHWFGSFRFAPGDPYPDGEWWHTLNPPKHDADLVFRTYVGKTVAQVTAERALRLEGVQDHFRERREENAPPPAPPAPIFPPGEVVPLPPPDPLPPVRSPAEVNGTQKPLLPFLRRSN